MSEEMTEPALERLMTFEEAAKIDPDSNPGELEAGRFVAVPKGTWRHGVIVINVGGVLKRYARSHPGWSVSAGDPGTKLTHNPDTLRGPDVAIVRTDRVPQGRGADGWLEGAPDVAVEVIGDAQSASELARKALEYLEAGGKMVWVIDPEPRRLMLFSEGNRVSVLGPDDTLEGGDVLPGFNCKVAEFFED